MSKVKKTRNLQALPLRECHRCDHVWFGRIPKLPKRCPNCSSPRWAVKPKVIGCGPRPISKAKRRR
jgi:predicted Zn-ribbon and HTH transcriptional regulator